MFNKLEIDNIVSLIEYHYSMMIFSSLGGESLSEVDKMLLQSYGVNIDEFKVDYPPYLQMFLLGRLTTILGDKNTLKLNKEDFDQYLKRGQFVPLSSREKEEYGISRQITYNHLKGLGGKVTGATRDILLEEQKKQIISEEISEGIKNRKSVDSIISDLGHRTGEWDRDWKRIVVTEMQNIFSRGRAAEIEKKYGLEAKVYKSVFSGACRHCIRLYLTNGIGSEPKTFILKELIANGSNVGRKVEDWLPTIDATHPFCRCLLMQKFLGQVWDGVKGFFKYLSDVVTPGKVKRLSKIKVTVGDKEFYV